MLVVNFFDVCVFLVFVSVVDFSFLFRECNACDQVLPVVASLTLIRALHSILLRNAF